MLAHRSPEDHGRNPDEISSHGFFCARVTLQQSGDALRVLNAGSQKLPAGTVVVCPRHRLSRPSLSESLDPRLCRVLGVTGNCLGDRRQSIAEPARLFGNLP